MSLLQDKAAVKFVGSIRETLRRDRLVDKGDRILVAVSGGADSVALLRVLLTLQPEFQIFLGIVHVDHGLRPQEARRDAAFVRRLAANAGLPCHCYERDVPAYRKAHKLSVEEAARIVRYECFGMAAAASNYNKVALGHHQDDNAELVLMRLIRGSGTLGLSAMTTFKDPHHGCPPIIRPLLAVTREALLHYLKSTGQKFVQDSTNADTRFLRNRVRNELLPLLKTGYNPNISDVLTKSAAILGAEEQWFSARTDRLLSELTIARGPGNIALDAAALRDLHPALLRRVLRAAIRRVKGNLRRIAYDHTEAAMRLLLPGDRTKTIDLPGRIRIGSDGKTLWVKVEARVLREIGRAQKHKSRCRVNAGSGLKVMRPDAKTPVKAHLANSGQYLQFAQLPMTDVPEFNRYGQRTAFFDMDKLTFPLEIRGRRPGDRFRPLGLGGEQKVSKFLSDRKIAFEQRARYPLLLSQGKVIWVVGQRIDERFKLTKATRMVLKAQVFLA